MNRSSNKSSYDVTSQDVNTSHSDGARSVFSTQASGSQNYNIASEVAYDDEPREVFEDPDTPLTLSEKVKFTSLLVFLYGMFILAVVLAAVYN